MNLRMAPVSLAIRSRPARGKPHTRSPKTHFLILLFSNRHTMPASGRELNAHHGHLEVAASRRKLVSHLPGFHAQGMVHGRPPYVPSWDRLLVGNARCWPPSGEALIMNVYIVFRHVH